MLERMSRRVAGWGCVCVCLVATVTSFLLSIPFAGQQIWVSSLSCLSGLPQVRSAVIASEGPKRLHSGISHPRHMHNPCVHLIFTEKRKPAKISILKTKL
jgi:hypothetical protein